MSIATQAAALAGMRAPVAFCKAVGGTAVAGAPISFYPIGGNPLAGLYPNTGLTGGAYSSSSSVPQGFLYHTDPAGSQDCYLGSLIGSASQPCSILLCDRLWDCEPATASTSAQSITSPSLPSRDALGGTAGVGVQIGIEVVAATSSTAAVVSMAYTNSAGTASRSAAFVDLPTAAATAIGRFFRIGLQAGDLGVQSVQSVTFTTDWTSGTIALVAYRVLAKLDLQVANTPNMIDVVSGGFPQIYNGSCLFFIMIPSTTTSSYISGVYNETQG